MSIKINEISIGDYISYCDRVYKVHSIDGQGLVGASNNSYSSPHILKHIGYLEPIPITAEILEANGFEDMGSGLLRYEWEWRKNTTQIMLGSFDEELWFADFDFCGKKNNFVSNIPMFYINQLQHILRLAGVEKEIIL